MFAPINSPPFQPPQSFIAHTPPPSSNLGIPQSGDGDGDSERSAPFSSESVGLSCLSPDSSSVHSLFPNGTIVTHFLPLHETSPNTNTTTTTSDEENVNVNVNEEEPSSAYTYQEGTLTTHAANKNKKPVIKSVKTKLPAHIIQSLQVDPPIEIICIDNDTPTALTRNMHKRTVKSLPLLCIYTLNSAFVLQITYEYSNSITPNPHGYGYPQSQAQACGKITHFHEPFESHLTTHSTSIAKIRPAPHSHMHNGNTYQTLCPRGAMLLLTSESCLAVFHGYKDRDSSSSSSSSSSLTPLEVTIAATIHEEQTDMTPIVDFGFLPSCPTNQHSIWNAFALILTTRSGNLYALSPVIFHSTVFPRRQVLEAQEMLEKMVNKYDHSVKNGAECRRGKAALQFWKDAFGHSSGARGSYIKANVLDHANQRSATRWPMALQKIDADAVEDGGGNVQCMEMVFPSSVSNGITGSMAGVALARGSSAVEYRMIPSGDNVLPRFGFESSEDEQCLDAIVADSAMVVERVVLGNEEEGEHSQQVSSGSVRLLPDPVDKTMMHHVSKKGVVTVTTNAVPLMERRLNAIANDSTSTTRSNGQGNEDEIKTNAWTSISIVEGLGKALNGVAISGDVQFGHVLVAILSDGTTEAMNMTAAMYLNEARNQLDSEIPATADIPDGLKQSDQVLNAMESIPPLYEQIKPQIEKISNGLSTMTKIVGRSTDPRKITPGSLATFLSTKQSSEQDVILPLKEMNSLVVSRLKYLRSMRDHQLEQLDQLKTTAKLLQDRMKATSEKMSLVESNTKVLSNRSAGVLATVRDLSPNITEAEYQYFKDIKRFAANCDKWGGTLEDIRGQCRTLSENATANASLDAPSIRMSTEQKEMCDHLLAGQNEILIGIKLKVKTMEYKRDKVVVACGLEEERKPLSAIADSRTNH